MNLFNARFYQNSVKYSDIGEYNGNIIAASNLAIWLYIDKEKALKYSCKVAANKYDVPINGVEKCLRFAVPKELIADRKGCNMPDYKKQDLRHEKIAEQEVIKHFKTI